MWACVKSLNFLCGSGLKGLLFFLQLFLCVLESLYRNSHLGFSFYLWISPDLLFKLLACMICQILTSEFTETLFFFMCRPQKKKKIFVCREQKVGSDIRKMKQCLIQQNSIASLELEEMRSSVSDRRDYMVCPKPRRLGLLNGNLNDQPPVRSLRLNFR